MEHKAKYGFLMDASRCIDCRACMVACSVENNVPMQHTRIWMKDTGVVGQFPNLQRHTIPYHCMHCLDPSCVSACTVGALQKNEDGIITYDNERCIGCRYCMYACPFEIPNFEWEQRMALIVKCDLCVSQLEEGGQPACSATCPTGAIRFGSREEMLELARERIKNNPQRYINHIYGEHENGGTCTFYISPVPFEDLGLPTTTLTESPAYFNRLVTHGTPAVAAGVAIGMTGVYMAIQRQAKDNAAASQEHHQSQPDDNAEEANHAE